MHSLHEEKQGLKVEALLNEKTYQKGIKISDSEMKNSASHPVKNCPYVSIRLHQKATLKMPINFYARPKNGHTFLRYL
jgi:hypothetical protein